MRLAVLAVAIAVSIWVVLGLTGCAFRAGPGEHGWISYEIWTQANLELELPFGSLCVGCLETGPEAQEPPEAP